MPLVLAHMHMRRKNGDLLLFGCFGTFSSTCQVWFAFLGTPGGGYDRYSIGSVRSVSSTCEGYPEMTLVSRSTMVIWTSSDHHHDALVKERNWPQTNFNIIVHATSWQIQQLCVHSSSIRKESRITTFRDSYRRQTNSWNTFSPYLLLRGTIVRILEVDIGPWVQNKGESYQTPHLNRRGPREASDWDWWPSLPLSFGVSFPR